MSGFSLRFRYLAREFFLWGQRRRWPLPPGFRSFVRDITVRSIDFASPGAFSNADEWPQLLTSDRPDDAAACIPAAPLEHQPRNPADTSISSPLIPHSQLRCMIATPTLKLGGLENVALFLARGLASHGFESVVVHTPAGPGDPNTHIQPAKGLRLDGLHVVTVSRHEIQEWLVTHRPDVISIHGSPDWLVAAAAQAGIPTVETLHGAHSFFDRQSWPSEQLRSQQISGFVAVSELVRRQYLRANHDYPPDRIITIPNGVDDRYIMRGDRTAARSWLGLRDEFLFISLARYGLQKNTFGLVAAFADVASAHPEARLLLAGDIVDAAYFEQVRRLRDSLSCASQILLLGPCPDVAAVLAAADGFVLNSFFEGWSLASMEALSAGLPVVTSDVGGAREQVEEDGRRGFVIGNPLGDPVAMDWNSMARAAFRAQINRAALAEAMSAVIKKRDHWREARQQLRAEAVARFSPGICIQRHAEVLKLAAAGERYLYR